MNKNITLSVPENLLRTIRRIAVQHDTTVNGVVRGYLVYVAQNGAPLPQRMDHEERIRRLDDIWKIVDSEKARIGKRIRRGVAYEGRVIS